MIEIKQLIKNFGETRALDDLNFTVREGSAFGLLGRNGAGKTTCIRIIMNIFRADSGEVLIDGVPSHKAKVKIGYLPEERGLYQKRTIAEQMVYIGKLRGLTTVQATASMKRRLEELEATEFLKRKLDTLSKGNQQKIQLAISLINDPDVIILDEPFSGLDPVNAMLLKNIVREQVKLGKTVIFSSHQMAQVEEFCDDICLINKGKSVLEGNLAQIKRSYPRNTILLTIADSVDLSADQNSPAYVNTSAYERPAAYMRSGARPANIPAILREKLGDGVGAVPQKEPGTWLVTLAFPAQRMALFRALDEAGISPELFAVKEPTLEEIFIEKAGYEPETEKDSDDEKPKRRRGLFSGRSAS